MRPARWFSAVIVVFGLALPAAARAALDEVQRAWLTHRGAVVGAPEHDYGPFIFATESGIEGLSVDLLALVQRHTGLVVRWRAAAPLNELLAAARAREVDLLTSLRPTPERAAYLLFTQPYVRVPAIVVMRAAEAGRLEAPPLTALKGRPVAVGAGYAVERPMRESHPEVDWRGVADDEVALRGVVDGRFSAAVVDAASASFVMRRRALGGLASVGEAGFNYELAFAVRRDEPQLLAILDAGIRAIDPAERQAVVDRWLAPLGAEALARRAPTATLVGVVLLLLALGAAVAVGWRREGAR